MLSIILSRRNFREYDQIITLYTAEKGKIEALARGVKKITSKNTAHLEPYFLAEVEVVPGRDLLHLTRVQPINIFKNIRGNLDKILVAGYIMKTADTFLQNGEQDTRIFNLLKNWLEYVDSAENVGVGLVYSFVFKFLNLLGFKPELKKCVSCGADEIMGLYFQGGGGVCTKCAQAKKQTGKEVVLLAKGEIEDLDRLLCGDWDESLQVKKARIFKMIFRFAQYHSERKLAYFSGI